MVFNGGFFKLGKTQAIFNSAPGSVPGAKIGHAPKRGVALLGGRVSSKRPNTTSNTVKILDTSMATHAG